MLTPIHCLDPHQPTFDTIWLKRRVTEFKFPIFYHNGNFNQAGRVYPSGRPWTSISSILSWKSSAKEFSKSRQTCYRTQPAISAQVGNWSKDCAPTSSSDSARQNHPSHRANLVNTRTDAWICRRAVQDAIAELENNPRGDS